MTAITIFTLPLLLTNTYAQHQPQLQPEKYWSTYEDQILGIKIQYPKGWEVEEEPNSVGFNLYYNESKPLVFTGVDIMQSLPEDIDTSEKLMKSVMNLVRGDMLKKINTIDNSVTMDNKPAYKADFITNLEDGTEDAHSIFYFLVDQDVAYTVSFVTSPEYYPEHYHIA
jgi:hypothetical protein